MISYSFGRCSALRRGSLASAVVLLLCLGGEGTARTEPYELGVALSAGWGTAHQQWELIGNGLVLTGALSLESPYFLSPVFAVSYARLAQESGPRDLGPGLGEVQVENTLSALALLLGPAFDWGPVRLSVSVGLSRLMVESSVDGRVITPSSWALGYAVELDAWPMTWSWGQLGLFAAAQFLAEAQLAQFSAGVLTRFDVVLWSAGSER